MYPLKKFTIQLLFGLFLLFTGNFYANYAVAQTITSISDEDLSNAGSIQLSDNWKVFSGDNFNWINSDFDYSAWNDVSTLLGIEDIQTLEWKGYGWFKHAIKVDSALVGKPLLLTFDIHNGASQVYLNEDMILRVGSYSIIADDEELSTVPNQQIIQFQDTSTHILTVRFSNHSNNDFLKYDLKLGFSVSIHDNVSFITNTDEEEANALKKKLFILIGLLTALTIVHFLFLIFYPQGENNLYFVLFATGITFFSLFYNFEIISTSPSTVLAVQKGIYIGWIVALIGLLKFAYSFLKNSTPVQLTLFLIIGIVILITKLANWLDVSLIISVFTLIVLLEVLRVYIIVGIKQKQHVSILIWGFIIYLTYLIYRLEELNQLITDPFILINNLGVVTFLVFSVSAYLLRDFAKAQIKLEYKFLEVKHLSERSIEQEKRSKVKEMEQQILERENQRKTAELEEARALQISMLPTQIPVTDYWEIDAYMNPSSEVGGDYYDFSISKTGELTVALGDATGHGMKAGIIVATAKSYFHSLVNEFDNVSIIKNMSVGIKNLDIKMMYMGLMLLKCKEHSIKFTSAGMPPALIYRKEDNIVEEALLKAMPLGSSINFPYEELEFNLKKGDVFLLFSDGLMELFNTKREQLGVPKIQEKLKELSSLNTSEIVEGIKALQKEWSGKAVQEDDVTLVVMKAK